MDSWGMTRVLPYDVHARRGLRLWARFRALGPRL